MQVDEKTLKRLENLELRQYAGDLDAFGEDDRLLWKRLMEQVPVEIRVDENADAWDERFYQIVVDVRGQHPSLATVRQQVQTLYTRRVKPLEEMRKTQQVQSPCMIAVLLSGIYVGDMEDLLNYRQGRLTGIIYPTRGLGTKIAIVDYLKM